MSKYRSKIPQVLVCIDPSLGPMVAIQQGIQRYAKLYGPWDLQYLVRSGSELQESLDRTFRGFSGIVAMVTDTATTESILSQKLPTVLIDPPLGMKSRTPISRRPHFVALDIPRVGKIAVDYFREKNISNFAFVPELPETGWSYEHQQAYSGELIKTGISVACYPAAPMKNTAVAEQKRLGQWLQQLPKPAAILAPSDRRARDVLNACRKMKIAVPYEIIVLGVGNDEIFCDSCFPTLSSIAVHWQRGGFAAAEMLDQLMRRTLKRHSPTVYEPVEVVSRDSTGVTLEDEAHVWPKQANDHVFQALEFIRINSGFCVQVEDVAAQVGVTRQWIERRFKATLGHSVLEEIRRQRMQRIKSLLSETDLTINQIAKMSGYENANHLRIVFKNEFRMTMTEFRDRCDRPEK